MLPALPKVRRFTDKALSAFVTEVQTFLAALSSDKRLRGNQITVSLTAGVPLAVTHGLPRATTGYEVIRRSAAAHVFDATGNGDLSKLWIQSDADVTVTLFVY